MSNTLEFGRLKQHILSLRASSKGLFLSASAFREWMTDHSQKHPVKLGCSHTDYCALLRGEPARWSAVIALTEYIATRKDILEKLGHDVTKPEDIAELAARPTKGESRLDAWRQGWGFIARPLRRKFRPQPEAEFQDRKDFELAARIGLACVGRHCTEGGDTLSDKEAIVIGARIMERSESEYADWLEPIRKASDYALQFVTLPSPGNPKSYERMGWVGVLPVVQRCYGKFKAGGLFDSQISPNDLQAPSMHMIVHMVADVPTADERRKKAISAAQVNSFSFQVAMLAETIVWGGARPSLVTFAGTPENGKKIEAMGGIAVGTFMPGSAKRPIFEIAPAPMGKRVSYAAWANYHLMNAGLMTVQAAFAEERQ